jgi:hypothetical protein
MGTNVRHREAPGPASRLPAGGVVMLRAAASGLGLGAGWGVLARVWMRMISTEPEFSWAGTLLIVGFAALAGLGLGLVHGARGRQRSRWWRLAVLAALPIVTLGPGAAFAPAFWLGGCALAGRGPRVVRVALGVVATGPVWLLRASTDPVERALVPAPTFVVGMLLLTAGVAWGGSQLFRRWPLRSLVAHPVRVMSAT